MMALSLLRTNPLTFLTLNSFVVIMFSLNYWTVLVSSLNTLKLKYFILADLKGYLTLHLSTFPRLEDWYCNPKTLGDTWDLSLIANYHSTNNQLLRQQSYLNGQVYEAFRKLITRYQSPPKVTTLQMLYPPNSSLWLSTMILQQGPNILPYENPRQNAEKSRHLDFGSLQNFALWRHWSHRWNYSNEVPSTKND